MKIWDNGWYVSCHHWLLQEVLVPHRLSCGKPDVQYTPVLVAWLLCRSPKREGVLRVLLVLLARSPSWERGDKGGRGMRGWEDAGPEPRPEPDGGW